MNNIKKVGILAFALMASMTLCAFPHRGYHHFHHHHRGGVGFAIGAGILGAGLLASAVYDATHPYYVAPAAPVVVTPAPVVTQPVVVQQPVVAQPVVQQPVVQQPVAPQVTTQMQNVWVEGRYVDQVNAQGQAVRVWQPGHYEQRQVQVAVP